MSRSPFAALDRWLFAPGRAGALHGTMTALSVFIAIRVTLSPFPSLASQPRALWRSAWIVGWLSEMPPIGVIIAVQAVGVVAAILSAMGRNRRVTFALAFFAYLFLAGLRASRGKIQHNDILMILTCVPFLAAPPSTKWFDDRESTAFGWPLRAGMVVVSIAYFLCGAVKVYSSGWRWVWSDNMRNVLYQASRNVHTHAPGLVHQMGDNGFIAKAMAFGTLVFELGFPLVLVYKRLRPIAVAVAVLLHGTIWVLIGLDYSMWVAAVAAVLLDWEAIVRWAQGRLGRATQPDEVSSAGTATPP